MATFTFTSPDGQTYDVEGPEGATQEQAFGMLQQHLGTQSSTNGILPRNVPAPTNPNAGPQNPDTFLGGLLQKGLPIAGHYAGLTARALVNGATGTATTLLDAPIGAYNWVTKHFGVPPVENASEVLQSTMDRYLGKPQNMAESLLVGAGSLAAGTRDPVANALREAFVPPIAPTLTEAQRTMQQAQQLGYLNMPSKVGAGILPRAMESLAGANQLQAQMQSRNQQVTNRVVNEALGLPAGTQPTKELFGGAPGTTGLINQTYQAAYDPIRNLNQMIDMGPTYRADLHSIAQQYNAVPKPGQGQSNNAVADLLQNFRSQQFTPDNAMTGIQALRQRATQAFTNGDAELGGAARALANRLESGVENSLPKDSQMYADFVNGRMQLAKLYAARAATIPGAGAYDARKFAAMATKEKPLTDGLDVVGKFATIAPQLTGFPYKEPGMFTTPEGWALGVGGLGKGILSGLGGDLAAGGTTLGGLATLAAAGPLARMGTRQLMMTGPFQSAFVHPTTPLLTQLRNNPALINALPTAFQLGSGLFGQ